jgi:glycosyltransferase involved in cell wall biosynthesis
MEVLVFTPDPFGVSPGQRTSIELWDHALRPEGINFIYLPFTNYRTARILDSEGRYPAKAAVLLRSYLRRALDVVEAGRFDAVLVYREAALIGPAFFERIVARRRIPLIYQLDDPLFVPYKSPTNGWLSYLKCFGKVKTTCRISRTVVVNSPQLEQFARAYNRNVWRVPSLIDGDRHRAEPATGPKDRLCVGWTGSPTTAPNLTMVAPALAEAAQKVDHDVHFIGAETFDVPGVRYTAQPWRAESEIEDLRRLDIGLLPVPDSPWNRWKFYVKLIQYMALGIPPICTPIGCNPDVIDHGVTGFLAGSHAEWVEALVTLLTDDELRHQMSKRVAEVAAERYTWQANRELILRAVRSAWE